MPPPEGSGTLTLYGHRLPSLYRAAIESQVAVTAKSKVGLEVAPNGHQGASGGVFAVRVWVSSDCLPKTLLTLLEISSGVWGQTAPTGYVIPGAY